MGFKEEAKDVAKVFCEAMMEEVIRPILGTLIVLLPFAVLVLGGWALMSCVRWMWNNPLFH